MPPMFDTRRFERALKDAKMTARVLAAKLGTSETDLSRIRTGRQQPRKPNREAIEQALGLEIGTLEIDQADLVEDRLRLDQLERKLVETMRTLTQHQREIVVAYAQGMSHRERG